MCEAYRQEVKPMNVALTVWNGRISPVFDVARDFLVLTLEDGRVVDTRLEKFDSGQAMQKPALLSALQIHTLICGAISRPLAEMATSFGIQTLSFIAGETEQVINAFLADDLPSPALSMPGCGKKHRGRADNYRVPRSGKKRTAETGGNNHGRRR